MTKRAFAPPSPKIPDTFQLPKPPLSPQPTLPKSRRMKYRLRYPLQPCAELSDTASTTDHWTLQSPNSKGTHFHSGSASGLSAGEGPRLHPSSGTSPQDTSGQACSPLQLRTGVRSSFVAALLDQCSDHLEHKYGLGQLQVHSPLSPSPITPSPRTPLVPAFSALPAKLLDMHCPSTRMSGATGGSQGDIPCALPLVKAQEPKQIAQGGVPMSDDIA